VAKTKKGGLGKGLDAMLGGKTRPDGGVQTAASTIASVADQLLHLDPRQLKPNPMQIRKEFDEESLQELAESIRRDGVQEPVIVRRADDHYELVSGERRVRASILADTKTVPAICRDVSDSDMLRLALVENIQREDLNPIELAEAYRDLVAEFKWTQEQLAAEVGKKRATVANMMRLLDLPADVQRHVADGSISMGHARALLAFETPTAQMAVCRRIIREGLSVRQVERMATPKPPKTKKTTTKDPNLVALEDDLRARLGTKVHLRAAGPGRGKIEIEYYSLDDLERILDVIRSGR